MLEPLRAEFHVSMALISLRGDIVREGGRKEEKEGRKGERKKEWMGGWTDGWMDRRTGRFLFFFPRTQTLVHLSPWGGRVVSALLLGTVLMFTSTTPSPQTLNQPHTHPLAPLVHLIFPLLSWKKKIAGL